MQSCGTPWQIHRKSMGNPAKHRVSTPSHPSLFKQVSVVFHHFSIQFLDPRRYPPRTRHQRNPPFHRPWSCAVSSDSNACLLVPVRRGAGRAPPPPPLSTLRPPLRPRDAPPGSAPQTSRTTHIPPRQWKYVAPPAARLGSLHLARIESPHRETRAARVRSRGAPRPGPTH